MRQAKFILLTLFLYDPLSLKNMSKQTMTIIALALMVILGGLFLDFKNNNNPENQSDKNIELKQINLKNMNSFIKGQSQIIRQPAVAGQFYPADSDELNFMIGKFLANTEFPKIKGSPQVLIVPHAGYPFSGQTAAFGFKTLVDYQYNNVIIIGSSHNFPVAGLNLYQGDLIRTPLADVRVNKKLINQLIQDENISVNNSIHDPEHSLEVQIPFLQKVLKNNFQIVLGLINSDNLATLESVSQAIYKIIEQNPGTLIIVSSDLSHYPDYENAKYSDNKILETILSKNINQLNNTIKKIMSENLPGLDTCACGASAVKIGMLLADKLNLNGQLVHYSNSGDFDFGDKGKVVGYGAVVFINQEPGIVNQGQEKYLCL